MIPNDGFTIIVINILVVMGLLGLFKPGWFITLSDFPGFLYRRRERAPLTDSQRRYARSWGLATLAGAAVLATLAYW